MSRRAAWAVLPAVLSVLALTGCAGTDPDGAAGTLSASSSAPAAEEGAVRRIEVAIREGRVSGDTGRVPVELGETVELVVTGDAADEVHVHGYDVTGEVTAGGPATLAFPADLPGVFEVELHEAGTVLLTLQVG